MSKLILALYVLTTSAGLIILKLGTKNGLPLSFANGKLHLNFNAVAIGGIILYGLSFILYMWLIAKNDLGYIIPLTTALVYIIIFVASYLVFRETFTITKILGVTFIISGLILLNFNK